MPATFALFEAGPAGAADELPLAPLVAVVRTLGAEEPVYLAGPRHVVAGPPVHALLHAAHLAFATHRPLALAPDVVWLTVLHGVSQHVARNAESLSERFVAGARAAPLALCRDHSDAAVPTFDWSSVPTELCDTLLMRRGPVARALRATFSTSSPASRLAMDVALLDVLCGEGGGLAAPPIGIAGITLLGTPDEWSQIVRRLDALHGTGLDAWLGPLHEVLVEFHRASRGEVDREFWRALYKREGLSGGNVVTGWINVLFPYLRESRASAPRDVVRHLPRNLPLPVRYDRSWLTDGDPPPKPDEFPLGLARARFECRPPTGGTGVMDLVAGVAGAGPESETGAIAPLYACWVAPATAKRGLASDQARPPSGSRASSD